MPSFKRIIDQSEIPNSLPDAAKFNSRDRVVTKGGVQYQLIAKKEQAYSRIMRVFRGVLGLILAAILVPLTFKGSRKKIIQLITEDSKKIRFGMQINAKNQKISPLPLSNENKIEVTAPILQKKEPIEHVTLSVPEPEIPRFPSLHELSLEPDHPLMKGISPIPFIKEPVLQKTFHSLPDTDKKFVLATGLDSELLNVSLLTWCGLDEPHDLNKIIKDNLINATQDTDFKAHSEKWTKAVEAGKQAELLKYLLNNPHRGPRKAIIDKRIKLLNETIQLEERLKCLGNKAAFLQVRDVLKKWTDSKLKQALDGI